MVQQLIYIKLRGRYRSLHQFCGINQVAQCSQSWLLPAVAKLPAAVIGILQTIQSHSLAAAVSLQCTAHTDCCACHTSTGCTLYMACWLVCTGHMFPNDGRFMFSVFDCVQNACICTLSQNNWHNGLPVYAHTTYIYTLTQRCLSICTAPTAAGRSAVTALPQSACPHAIRICIQS
jgi:hypothetical protein